MMKCFKCGDDLKSIFVHEGETLCLECYVDATETISVPRAEETMKHKDVREEVQMARDSERGTLKPTKGLLQGFKWIIFDAVTDCQGDDCTLFELKTVYRKVRKM